MQDDATPATARARETGRARGSVIAIIGAGFSGTMAAVHLLRTLPPDYSVLLCERSGRFARGLAFASSGTPHVLNVRSTNMSAFPDQPAHFEEWLDRGSARGGAESVRTEAGRFATRRLYGSYLRALLYEALQRAPGRLRLQPEAVDSIVPTPGGYRLLGGGGRSWDVAGVVLAVGNLPSRRLSDGVVFHDPWADDATSGLLAGRPMLVVGTGLTMVDLVLATREHGFAGPIVVLSRRGLLPQRHAAPGGTWPKPEFTAEERVSLLAMLRRVRAEVAAAAEGGIGWRAVIDALRPVTVELWRGLPARERSRFLRHLRPYWDVHRHRTAPDVADAFEAMLTAGTVQVRRGRLGAIERRGDGAVVSWQPRGGGDAQTLSVQRVIFATGVPASDEGDPLIASLSKQGLARIEPHGLGLAVTEALQIIGSDGEVTPGLWALGPIVRGAFWECTAVPDIRVQARMVADEIARACVG